MPCPPPATRPPSPRAPAIEAAEGLDLEALPLFRGVSRSAAKFLLDHGRIRRHQNNQSLFRQGGAPQYLYIVLDGLVVLSVDEPGGRRQILEFCGEGELLDLASVIEGAPHMVSAVTARSARTFRIQAQAIQDAIARYPSMAVIMSAILARHLRETSEKVQELKLQSVSQRLAAYLVTLAKRTGANETVLPIEKRLLAARLGTSAESLSRAFARLRALGVRTVGQTIEIADLVALQKFSSASTRLC